MTKILVIGTQGQVSEALRTLSAQESAEFIFWGMEDYDLTKAAEYSQNIAMLKPDVIVNAAAYTAVDNAETAQELAFKINAEGVEILAKDAAVLDIPFIHISTDYVYQGNGSNPYTEDEPINPQNIYGKSKAEGDKLALAAHPKTIILRTAWVYSDFGNNFVKTMLRLGAEREELSIIDDQHGCPTSAYEIARAIIAIIHQMDNLDGKYGVYHCAGKGQTTWFGFAKEIFVQAKNMGHTVPQILNSITSDQYPTAAKRPLYSVLDCSKLEQAFAINRAPWQTELAHILRKKD